MFIRKRQHSACIAISSLRDTEEILCSLRETDSKQKHKKQYSLLNGWPNIIVKLDGSSFFIVTEIKTIYNY